MIRNYRNDIIRVYLDIYGRDGRLQRIETRLSRRNTIADVINNLEENEKYKVGYSVFQDGNKLELTDMIEDKLDTIFLELRPDDPMEVKEVEEVEEVEDFGGFWW